MSKELKLAWAAGFFDGEGSVVIELSVSKGSTFGQRTSLPATVTQTSTECLDIFVDMFGGNIKACEHTLPHSRRWAVQYTWSVRNEKAIAFLKQILPYTVVKKEQIKVALKYPMYNESGRKFGSLAAPMPLEVWETRLKLRQELKDIRASMKTMAVVRH